ncbi:MAG: tyrosine-type recombinase/integrase [Candidatus Thorarchaeota archaeon]
MKKHGICVTISLMKAYPFQLVRRGVKAWEKRGRKGKKPIFYVKMPGEPSHHSTGQTTKSEALKEAWKMYKQKGYTSGIPAPVFADYASTFFTESCPYLLSLKQIDEKRTLSPSTLKSYKHTLKDYLLTAPFAGKKIDQIEYSDLNAYNKLLMKDKTASQRRYVIVVLRIIFKMALTEDFIIFNPALQLKQPKVIQKVQTESLSISVMRALFEKYGPDTHPPFSLYREKVMFFLQATTGMRSGEVRALKWKDIDFDNHKISVNKNIQIDWTKSTDAVFGPTKNRTARVTVFPRVLGIALMKHKERMEFNEGSPGFLTGPDSFVFSERVVEYGPQYVDEDGMRKKDASIVESGKPYRQRQYQQAWKTGLDHIGLKVEAADTNINGNPIYAIRPHSLRHTANSILMGSKEANPQLIRASFGWSGEQIQDIYNKFHPEQYKEQRSIMDDRFDYLVDDESAGEYAEKDKNPIPMKTRIGLLQAEIEDLKDEAEENRREYRLMKKLEEGLWSRIKLLESSKVADKALPRWTDVKREIYQYMMFTPLEKLEDEEFDGLWSH